MRFTIGMRPILGRLAAAAGLVTVLLAGGAHAESVSIEDEAGSSFKGAKRVVIAQFGVEYYTQYANVGRSGGNTAAQISQLVGVSDATMQSLVDKLYADTQAKLKEAGFEVMDYATLAADAQYQALVKTAGKPSPFVVHDAQTGTGTEHISKLFSPTGRPAFWAIGGSSIRGAMGDRFDAQNQGTAGKEGEIAKRLDVTLLKFNFLANYAATKASKNGLLATFAGTAARVSMEAMPLLVPNDTQVQFVNAEGARVFGNIKRPGQSGAFFLKEPLQGANIFDVVDNTPAETKSGDMVSNAISGLFGTKTAVKNSTLEVKTTDTAYAEAYSKLLASANEALIKSLK